MNHQEGTFKGVRNANIYYQSWLPEGKPKAVLLIVHGIAEHSGRYMNVVNHFVPLGYAAYSLDHIGHGKSEGQRVFVERFEDFTDTLKIYFDMVRQWQPGKPIFLVGHSMGGLIGARYLLDHQSELAGAVLSGPAIKISGNISPALVAMSKLISALAPRMGLVGLSADGICRDPAVVQAYVKDPLVYTGKTTARLGSEMLKAAQQVLAGAATVKLPILIVQGGADQLLDPAGAKALYGAVASADKTLKIYDGYYHEVFNDPGHEVVLGEVAAWVDGHVGA